MKIIIKSLLASTCLATSAFAQFSSLPPSSTVDGITVKSIGLNAGSSRWESLSSLGAYSASGDGYSDPVNSSSPDSHLGLSWQQTAPTSLDAARATLNAQGGVLRVIVVGETAQWLNDFGYTYSGKPTGPQSFTVLQNIQSIGSSANVHFGDYIDIPLTAGEASKLDLWYNSVGDDGLSTPSVPTGQGGIYTAFNPTNGDPSSTANQFLWANKAVKANTWIPTNSAYAAVDTYMVGMEDWRISAGSDRDYSDLRLALQFFDASGTPLAAIPEPANMGLLLGLVAIAGTIAVRRRAGDRSAQTA